MNEQQAEKIIKLLESIDSRLSNIESNSNEIGMFSSESYTIDRILESIKRLEDKL